jgi:cell wall-associated NlpC family hydrolase
MELPMIRLLRALIACIAVVALSACATYPASEAPVSRPSVASKRDSAAAPGISLGERAAAIAYRQIGTPYVYGGESPSGFDCSGLVHYAYRQAGKSLPRTTGGLWSGSRAVAVSDLEVGDLLFFSIAGKMQHVGLYLGRGRFVHAPSSGRTVTVESLSSAFYRDALLRGGRPL